MNLNQTVAIQSELDIIKARMCVRDLARHMGMPLGDQARISLAASSLAQAMELGGKSKGRMLARSLDNAGRVGIQVVCVRDSATGAVKSETLGEIRWIVDNLTIDTKPANSLQITLVKWTT
jgi:hypothetical protein